MKSVNFKFLQALKHVFLSDFLGGKDKNKVLNFDDGLIFNYNNRDLKTMFLVKFM